MSRIGKQHIKIPEKTEVTVVDGAVSVKGPLGTLTRFVKPDIRVMIEDGSVILEPVKNTLAAGALWGTYASHIGNMVAGVNTKFEKKLVIEGIGFRAEVLNNNLKLLVGFSHPVLLPIPNDLEVTVLKNVITIQGIDKETVGQFAANVRAVKKPEPYKGKGIRYEGEVVRRKQGKKAST